jgi:hypothetical protein
MMSDIGNLIVEVRAGNIIVSLSGSVYAVTYYKPSKSPQLLAKLFPINDDPRAPMTQGEFLAHAWRAANDKARVLGWIK